MSEIAKAKRDCALGLLRTAKSRKAWAGTDPDVARLVSNARWYWRSYLREISE